MSVLLVTLLATFIFIVIALAALGIGLIVKGKSILKPGACGRDPNKNRGDETCQTNTCSLCEPEKEKDDEISKE